MLSLVDEDGYIRLCCLKHLDGCLWKGERLFVGFREVAEVH